MGSDYPMATKRRYAMDGSMLSAKPKRPKYGNKKSVCDGIVFESIRERKRYQTLKILVKAGEISELRLQPKFKMVHNGLLLTTYSADFEYIENGKRIIEDVKSKVTAKERSWRIIKKMMKAFHEIDVRETY